ncbi:hypothetical protein BH10BAC4_BH10BAC4_17910 [soil metagenome]
MRTFIARALGILLMVLPLSCKDRMCCAIVDVGVDVYVKDQSGNNLMDPSTSGFYDQTGIKLFDLDNGVRTQLFNTNTNRYTIVQEGKDVFLRIFPKEPSTNSEITRTTYIQWRTNDEDVIESTLSKSKDSSHCTKVKCNGTVKYDSQTASSRRVVEIIK